LPGIKNTKEVDFGFLSSLCRIPETITVDTGVDHAVARSWTKADVVGDCGFGEGDKCTHCQADELNARWVRSVNSGFKGQLSQLPAKKRDELRQQ
jgi:hypothetical protein